MADPFGGIVRGDVEMKTSFLKLTNFRLGLLVRLLFVIRRQGVVEVEQEILVAMVGLGLSLNADIIAKSD